MFPIMGRTGDVTLRQQPRYNVCTANTPAACSTGHSSECNSRLTLAVFFQKRCCRSHKLTSKPRPNFSKFYACCPWPARRSFSRGVAIRYVLPSCFHMIMGGRMAHHAHSDKDRKYRGRSLLSTTSLLSHGIVQV